MKRSKRKAKVNPIERQVASITEGRRASYLFNTKAASEAVGCVPNKFEDWWRRTQIKLIALARTQPAALGGEMACIFTLAQAQQEQRPPDGRST